MNKENIFQTLVGIRDKKSLDPSERSDYVYSFLVAALRIDEQEGGLIEHPLLWDMLCFSSGFVALFAEQSQDEHFIALAKVLNNYIHTIHYSLPNDAPQLGPRRSKHESIWTQRIKDQKDGIQQDTE